MLTANTILQERYLVVRPLGHGGMGAVYEAVDQRLGARVALKETLVAGEPLLRAFEREARLLSGLRHPALPVVTDYFAEGTGRFLVMQYIPGEDLGSLLVRSERPFAVETVLRWGDQVLDALAYLHAQEPPILHRDVKPQNLKLTPDGSVILLDFGLAKGGASFSLTDATTGSIAAFTPHYAPLEQVRGLGTDVRSDLYALAATLYTLLTKRVPVDAVTRADAVVNRQPDPLPRVDAVNPAVPAPVADLLHSALDLSRDDRPRSALEMRAALRAVASSMALPESTEIATAVAGATRTAQPHEGAETAVAGAPRTASPRGATTSPATIPPTAPPEAPTVQRRSWMSALLVGLGLAAIAVLGVAIAVVGWYWSRGATKPPPVNLADASTVEAQPTPLASSVILGRGSKQARYYALTGGPGMVDMTVDGVASGANMFVEALEGGKPLRFESGSPSLTLRSEGHHERKVGQLYLERKGPVVLKISSDYPDNVAAFRLQLAGPLELASRQPGDSDPKMLDAIAAKLAARDAPTSLTTRQVVGRNLKDDAYFTLRAGPGDVTVTLSAVADAATVSMQVFAEDATWLEFDGHGATFGLRSEGHDERATAHLVLKREQPIVVRVMCDYPNNLKAYRIALDGPAALETGVTSAAPGLEAATVAAPFADRDAPVALPAQELTGRGIDKDLYYAFEVGPGEMKVTLALDASAASAAVQFYDETNRPIPFVDGESYFAVQTSGGETVLSNAVELDRRRRIVMRFSQKYPRSVVAYRLTLEMP